MGFFARLARILRSNVNALISGAEDPEKMLTQIILDMGTQLGEAKRQVAQAIADEKKLQKQFDREAVTTGEWERKAMLAVKAGDDNLAKEALLRMKEHQELCGVYRDQWQKQKASVDQLKLALRALNAKIEEAKRKKSVLIARKKRAEAQQSIHETMSGMKSNSAFAAFERIEAKVDDIEAQAEASAEMAEEGAGDVLARKFSELEGRAGADDDLAALKRKMGLAPPEAAPAPTAEVRGDTSSAADALDDAEQDELAAALAELEAEEQRALVTKG